MANTETLYGDEVKAELQKRFQRLTARGKRLVRIKTNKGMRKRKASGQFRLLVRDTLKG